MAKFCDYCEQRISFFDNSEKVVIQNQVFNFCERECLMKHTELRKTGHINIDIKKEVVYTTEEFSALPSKEKEEIYHRRPVTKAEKEALGFWEWYNYRMIRKKVIEERFNPFV